MQKKILNPFFINLTISAFKGASLGLILGFMDFYIGYFYLNMSIRPVLLFIFLYIFLAGSLSVLIFTVVHFNKKIKEKSIVYKICLLVFLTYFLNVIYINFNLLNSFNLSKLTAAQIISNLVLLGLVVLSIKFLLNNDPSRKFLSSDINFYSSSILMLGMLNYNQYFNLKWIFPIGGFFKTLIWVLLIGLLPMISLLMSYLFKSKLNENKPYVLSFCIIMLLIFPFLVRQPSMRNYQIKYDKTDEINENNGRQIKHNVFWIVMDTARRDRLSLYGNERNTTPNLDEFAKDGIVFTNAVANAPWTVPSHASMFTGMYPSKHGTHHTPENSFSNPLSKDNKTIAEILRENGYKTSAIVANYAIGGNKGFEQGFELYYEGISSFQRFFLGQLLCRIYPIIRYRRNFRINRFLLSSQINDSVLHWIDNNKDNKFFMFINFMDVHAGFNYLPDGFDKKFNFDWNSLDSINDIDMKNIVNFRKNISQKEQNIFIDVTDCKLNHLDHNLGKLFEELKRRDLYDDSIIIVTSDHGTLWGEHNSFGHMTDLYNELLYVPLIIKYPKSYDKVGVHEDWVQLIDIMPEILFSLNIPIPENVQGRPVDNSDHEIISEVFRNKKSIVSTLNPERFYRDTKAIYSKDRNFKYIQTSSGKSELYNLQNDPYESNNLFEEMPKMADNLNQKIVEWQNSFEPIKVQVENSKIDTTLLKQQLKSLGYIK